MHLPALGAMVAPCASSTVNSFLAGTSLLLLGLAPQVRAQATTALVSADSSGVEGDNGSYSPSVSFDGRFVAFSSLATNLVANDMNFVPDVFLRDRTSGTTTRVSVDSNGAEGNNISWYPAVSGNGRFVAFGSFATNLVPNDTNGFIDAFVHDLVTGQTERVSLSSSGTESNASMGNVALSFDGRYVAFDCDASNLVTGDNNLQPDIFWHDRQTGQTVRVSVSSSGVEGNGLSRGPSISSDGRYVCFASVSTNLVLNDTNQAEDMFVHDTQTGQTVRVSVSSSGAQGSADSNYGMISGDGRWVSFTSLAPDLVTVDVNGSSDVFVHDMQTGQTSLVSLDSSAAQGNGGSDASSISSDGRHVSFWSASTNLVTPPTTTFLNVYVRDRQTATTTLVSVDSNGVEGDDLSFFSSISGDGRVVAFESNATNLVPNDTNFQQDIFAHDGSGPAHTSFCAGDGSGTACPCGNSSAPGSGEGCASSLGIGGHLAGFGTASILADSITLSGAQMPNSSALYFQGTTETSSGQGSVFGDGLRCAGGSIVRLGAKLNVGGTSQFPAPGDPSVSVRGACHAGDFRTYQVWYRNAAAFCTPSTFNLTNGVELTWTP